jgi:ribosomal protein S18 acetylase RimI-like enzyme
MSKVDIRVLREDDWQIYKSLRLRALQESPDSFGSTYQQEFEFTDDEWISRLSRKKGANKSFPLVAEASGNPAGLAWGQVHDHDTKTAYVYQMWVAPEARGSGIGRELLSKIISWAKDAGQDNVKLAVTTTNSAAFALYRSSGFEPYGDAEELRPGSALNVQPMILELRSDAA